jgi:hypothetical protein
MYRTMILLICMGKWRAQIEGVEKSLLMRILLRKADEEKGRLKELYNDDLRNLNSSSNIFFSRDSTMFEGPWPPHI